MSFVPVEFSLDHRAIIKKNVRNAFLLAPSSFAVALLEPPSFTDFTAARDRLAFRDVADHLEVHGGEPHHSSQ